MTDSKTLLRDESVKSMSSSRHCGLTRFQKVLLGGMKLVLFEGEDTLYNKKKKQHHHQSNHTSLIVHYHTY